MYHVLMYFILIDKQDPTEDIFIVRFIERTNGWHRMAGCSFSFNGELKLKKQHFFFTDAFKGKRVPGWDIESDDFYTFHLDPEAEGLYIYGIGEFSLDQLDLSLFFPKVDTEWIIWE